MPRLHNSASTEQAEGYVFRDIENITIDHGLPGKKADMPELANDDTYNVSQLYKFVKDVKRKNGGIKYSVEDKNTYLFPYTKRKDGISYSPSVVNSEFEEIDSQGKKLTPEQQEYEKKK